MTCLTPHSCHTLAALLYSETSIDRLAVRLYTSLNMANQSYAIPIYIVVTTTITKHLAFGKRREHQVQAIRDVDLRSQAKFLGATIDDICHGLNMLTQYTGIQLQLLL